MSRTSPRPPRAARRLRLPPPPRRRRRLGRRLVVAFAAAGLAGDWSADYSTPGSESRAAAELLQERFPERSPETVDVVWQAPGGAGPAAVAAADRRALRDAAGLEGVGAAPARPAAEISRDGTIGVLRIPLTELPGAVPHATGESLIELAERASGDGVRVELGGQLIANAQEGEISSEAVGLAIAALVLLLTFGSVVAAGLPLATALFGLGISRRAHRAARRGARRARLGAGARLDARHRRRDRLRAADRHALPRRAGGGRDAARGGGRGGRHRRALGADRRARPS